MEYAQTKVVYKSPEKEPERKLSIVNTEKNIDEPVPAFNFIKTTFENSQGLKTWVSLIPR